jgi:hypothetical protein
VAIHTADDWRNVHAHILLTHREYGPDGFGEIANRRTITKKVKGQEKQIEVAGIAATPHDIKALREQWANCVNRAYEQAGYNIRVDHRSFEDRGITELPTIHLGAKATGMERRGEPSERGDINRVIEFGNAELRNLEAEKQRQDAQIIDLQKVIGERLAQQQPRTDGTEKNYSKQQGGEIPPQPKDPQAMPDEQSPPANQNQQAQHVPINTINPDPWNALPDIDFRTYPTPDSSGSPGPHLVEQRSAAESAELEQRKADTAAKVREAWQQPAFSLDSIRADPWTAVYLPAPENASQTLLNAAYNAAGRCIEAIDHQDRQPFLKYADAAPQSPLISQGDEADNRAKAEARRDELQARLFPIGAPAAEEATRQRIAALEASAQAAATEMLRTPSEPAAPEPVRNDPVRTLRPAEPQPGRYDQLKVEIVSSAQTAPQIDLGAVETPDPVTAPTAAAEATAPLSDAQGARVMRFEAGQAVAGQEAVAESIQDGAQRTVAAAHATVDRAERISERVLSWISGQFEKAVHYMAEFLAPEPKMTRQQVHDTLQANVGNLEKDYAQAVDAAQQADAAAYEQQAHELKTAEQQGDLSLAQRFGRNATREANLGKEHEADHGHELE